MSKPVFYFIAGLLFLLTLGVPMAALSIKGQMVLALPLILLLGLPHGAIDHVLFRRRTAVRNRNFLAGYLLLIFINVALWLLVPALAYLLFLLLSAYHFGESQFSHYFNQPRWWHKVLYGSWGLALIGGLVFFKLSELQPALSADLHLKALLFLHGTESRYVLLFGVAVTIVLLVGLMMQKKLSVEIVALELLVLCLLFIAFRTLPVLIAFLLYFIILHSLKVLAQEYDFLRSEGIVQTVKGFLKLVAPMTLLSLVGIALLALLIEANWMQVSYGYAFLVLVSSITFPHVFVMHRFYARLFQKDKAA